MAVENDAPEGRQSTRLVFLSTLPIGQSSRVSARGYVPSSYAIASIRVLI